MNNQRLSLAGAGVSLLLCAVRMWVGMASGSLAVLSDALNSFLDVFAYAAMAFSVRVQHQGADRDHPFGHRRAEPLAGLLIAILAAILGATLIKDGVLAVLVPRTIKAGPLLAGLLVAAMGVKALLTAAYRRAWQRTGSTAMQAGYVDSRNDSLASVAALVGLLLGGVWDTLAAIALGGWIIYSGARIGVLNLGYLMGNAPDAAVLQSIQRQAAAMPHVLGVHDLRAHYVGDLVHVEVHIELPSHLSLCEAHAAGLAVKQALEAMPEVHYAFVHIDPVAAPA